VFGMRQFCAESRNFVTHAEHLVSDYLRDHSSGVTLRELCDKLSAQLGEWPQEVCLELANAISGHVNRGVETGRFEVDRSASPYVYRTVRR